MLVDGARLYRQTFAAGLMPDPDLNVWQWADAHRMMPKGYPEEGLYRTARTPYVREIMERLSPSDPCQRIKVMKGTQLGWTEVINNWAGFVADICPAPMMIVLPTVDLAKRHSRKKLGPTVKATARLREKIKDPRSRSSNNTILYKEFHGGSWCLAGANSAATFRSDSIRFLALDDIDGYPLDVDGEGDPCDLAENRTDAYASRKILLISTPTQEGLSRIEKEITSSDRRHYYVPCPLCKKEQVLKFGGRDADFGIKFERDKHTAIRAWYVCEHCHQPFGEHHKPWMLENGVWIPHNPGHPEPGYILPSYYSPLGWVSWLKIAREFLAAGTDQRRLKRWVNTRAAETFKEEGSRLDWQTLKSRAEPYPILEVPRGGLFLAMGVDVHPNRLEIETWAFGRGEEAWLIHWGQIYGNIELDDPWAALDGLRLRPYRHASGVDLFISSVAVDAGDGNTTHAVRNYCRKRLPQVIAVKGSSKAAQPAIGRPTLQDVDWRGEKIKDGVQIWPVGTDTAKALIYQRLQLQPNADGSGAPRCMHFPMGLEDDFYKQLTAEKQVTVYQRGYPKRAWRIVEGRRNEALDTAVYAYAAAIRAGLHTVDWDELERAVNGAAAKRDPGNGDTGETAPKMVKSKWMGGR